MRLVLDTNVLIAAFIAKGSCHTLLQHCLQRHLLITSEFILTELRDKLIGKFKYSQTDTVSVETFLRSNMTVVEPLILESRVCRDPDDDLVLATALAGEAICILSVRWF